MESITTLQQLHQLTERFGTELKAQDQEQFATTTYENTKRAINNIQSQQVETRTMMNLNRLAGFMDGMHELEETLSSILDVENAERVMAYIWGTLQFLLKQTNRTEKAFDNVLDVYEMLGVEIPKLSQYAGFFHNFPESTACLINIYRDIQRFNSIAYHLFSLRSKLWQKIHKSVWRDFKPTFKSISNSLASHASFLTDHGAMFRDSDSEFDEVDIYRIDSGLVLQNSQASVHLLPLFYRYCNRLTESSNDFEEKEKERKEMQRRKVQGWISSSNKIQQMHERFRKTRICPDSGRWLFRSYGEVSSWMKDEVDEEDDISDCALWLHGSKGFGKTILASLIVDELKSPRMESRLPPDTKTYFFYCQEDDDDHRRYLDILKGVLHQMVDQVNYIVPLCIDKIEQGGGDTLATEETAQTLIEAFIEYSPRQYIIIDGLDECETAEVRLTARFFMDQITKCNQDLNMRGQLRVLFMSQPMAEVWDVMPQDAASITLKSVDNADDIRDYVKKRMTEFSKSGDTRAGFNLSEDDKQQIESIVCNQSQDMFLYAHLAIEYLLQQPTKGDVLEKSRKEMLPEGLSEIYEGLLGSVEAKINASGESKAHWEKSKLLLGWLVCAKRSLKWHEMQAILSFDSVNEKFDFDNQMLRHNVRKYLGSLVHLLDGGYVRLIHTTARRYIINNKYIDEKFVQCQLTGLCLKYLSLPCFIDNYDEQERRQNAKFGWFSFQDYACSQWFSHVDTIIRECSDVFTDESYFSAGREIALAMTLFISTHDEHIKDSSVELHPQLERTYIDRIENTSVHEILLRLWNHIFIHQKADLEVRNTVGIKQIDDALDKNRSALEELDPSEKVIYEDTLEDYYGPNLFKCRRTLCRFFYAGYDNLKARRNHDHRHKRPYPCPASCSSAPVGFATSKDKDRHVRIYHPELSEGPSVFEALSSRQGPGKFVCNMCNRSYTRKINLKGHERTHFGDRPYACSTCGKAFTRLNDCRRHERNRTCGR